LFDFATVHHRHEHAPGRHHVLGLMDPTTHSEDFESLSTVEDVIEGHSQSVIVDIYLED